MPLTPEDVQNKRFTVVRFGKSGYDEDEVDAFLDEVEAEMRRLMAESASLRTAAEAVPAPAAPVAAAPPPEPVAPPEEPNETALRTLQLAQRTADDAVSQAKAEADHILLTAKVRAASLEQEAQATHASTLADLARQRQAIEGELAALRVFDRDYRTRLRAYLEGQLGELDQLNPTFGAVAPSPTASSGAASGAASSEVGAPGIAATIPPSAVEPARSDGPDPAPAAPAAVPPELSAPPSAQSPLAAAAAAAAAAQEATPSPDAPPTAPTPAVAPRIGVSPDGASPGPSGPFSSAPPLAVPSVAPPADAGLFTAAPGFATDVDAASDLPFAPPVEAGNDTVDDTRG